MQGGTKREVISWKLSAAFVWCFLMLLNVFVCNVLLQNAYKNHQKYVRKTDENGPKMVPKPLQNRSWRGSGGHLGATLETRCFQDLISDDLGSILGLPLGPVWAHFGYHFFDVFLKWLFDGLGLHLGSQKTSKMSPKKGSQAKPINSSILLLFTTLWPHSVVLKMVIFWYFLGALFWKHFWTSFWWFWLTFGVPFGDHFGHF